LVGLTLGVDPTKHKFSSIFAVKLSHFVTYENSSITINQPSLIAKKCLLYKEKSLVGLTLGVDPTKLKFSLIFAVKLSHFVTYENSSITINQPSLIAKKCLLYEEKSLVGLTLGVDPTKRKFSSIFAVKLSHFVT
jgi:hypothetical protein